MAAESDQDLIRSQADKIIASGVLGRSRFYKALFEYLLHCGQRGHAPKEVEIAADVFGRGDEFDPSQDSMVRVYAHNLRQKLQQYYAGPGSDEPEQITLPKGEYRIVLESPVAALASAGIPAPHRRYANPVRLAFAIVVSLAAGVLLGRAAFVDRAYDQNYRELRHSALWSEVMDDDTPVTIVVGDYYIFGERDRYGNVVRMVREFDINSSRDLFDRAVLQSASGDGESAIDDGVVYQSGNADRYVDLDLTYLPTSMAFAMRDLMRVLAPAGKPIAVVASSNLNTTVIRESHIVYLGYLSGLGLLSDFVFGASDLAIGENGENYDEIVNTTTGEVYLSEAGLPTESGSYRDYGLFATLPGPGGHQLIVVAGTRDEGLMQTAAAVSDPDLVDASIDALTAADGSLPTAFELLYEVAGLDRTNLSATIVHTASLVNERVTVGQFMP